MTTMPPDEIQAIASRNLATKAQAKVAANDVVLKATRTATAKAIAEAEKTMKRAEDENERLRADAAKADADARVLEAGVQKRQAREAALAGGFNGRLARYYDGQNNAAMTPAHYAATINERNAALRRMVG